jgi:hypothetical protein
MPTPIVDHDETYFLALFDRVLDVTWITPLKLNPATGYEMLQARGAVGARVSDAIANLERGNVIVFAAGGSFATVTVQFSRPTSMAGDVIVKAGTIVTTSVGGRDFATTADTVFAGGALGPINTPARAIAPGWQWNAKGQVITAASEILPGEIDTIKAFVQTANVANGQPTFIDGTITVAQIVDATGGADPMLDGLGADRGVLRRPGENDISYALRIRTLPDTVSPGAIQRAMVAFFAQWGLAGMFVEEWSPTFQTAWDMPLVVNATYANLFVYDDPRPPTPFQNRWLDDIEMAGAFVVVAPNFQPLTDYGGCFDDVGELASSFTTPPPESGTRAVEAWDIGDLSTDGALGWCWDGADYQKQATYAAFWQLLQQIKAGGVAAILELAGQ